MTIVRPHKDPRTAAQRRADRDLLDRFERGEALVVPPNRTEAAARRVAARNAARRTRVARLGMRLADLRRAEQREVPGAIEVAGQLVDLLIAARKAKVSVALVEYATFLKRLNDRTVAGECGHEPVWRLLLELLQRLGTQDQFEEKAVDYAITFELSPPSWENLQRDEVIEADASAQKTDDAYYLSGEIRNSRFDDLVPVLEGSQHPILDFTRVSRMDFVSAGLLVNRLAPYKAQGKDITIRGPNRLIAELMAVVGLSKQFRVIVPKF